MSEETLWRVNRERHCELLNMAQATRLVKGPRLDRSSRRACLFFCLGERLVSLGLRLQARYEPHSPGTSGTVRQRSHTASGLV
jgi:hypothetical protein